MCGKARLRLNSIDPYSDKKQLPIHTVVLSMTHNKTGAELIYFATDAQSAPFNCLSHARTQ